MSLRGMPVGHRPRLSLFCRIYSGADKLKDKHRKHRFNMTDVVQGGIIPTSPISQTDIESLKKLYTFREPTEVLHSLEKYPFLVPLLLEAKGHVRYYFPASPLFLEYVPEPEIDNHLLALHIGTDLDSESAMDTLEQLYKDWWVNVSIHSQGKLCIDVE